MWTMKLHRTQDGASVTIPKDVLKLWARGHAARVRVELTYGGRLVLTPYTDDLQRLSFDNPPGGEQPGNPKHPAGPDRPAASGGEGEPGR